MTRVLILLGITALACRDKEAPKPVTPGSAAAVTAGSAAVSQPRTDKAPELRPEFGSDTGSISVAERFQHEDVDPVWRSHTEADLKALLAKHPAETECRASICRVMLTGSEDQLAGAMDALQELRNHAQSLVLSRPEPTKIVAYLTFERAD